MDLFEKILGFRKSRHWRSPNPERAFSHRLDRARQVLELVENHSAASAVINEARRGFLVSLVAAFEVFWRDLFIQEIRRARPGADVLARVKDIRFSLSDLHGVFKDRISLGELVVATHRFNHPDAVNSLASRLLGVDFFASLRAARFKITIAEGPDKGKSHIVQLGKQALSGLSLISRCVNIRHEAVHGPGTQHRPSAKLLRSMERAMWSFNMIVGMHFVSQMSNLSRAQRRTSR